MYWYAWSTTNIFDPLVPWVTQWQAEQHKGYSPPPPAVISAVEDDRKQDVVMSV